MRKISLASQSNQFNYNIGLSPVDSFNLFEFGFLNKDLEKVISFSGQSGKMYDSDENFFFGYSRDNIFSISGNVFPLYHNYFVDGVPYNLSVEKPSDSVEWFYIESGNAVNYSLSVNGELPNYEITNPVFTGGNQTGEFLVKNLNFGINENVFRFYSGDILNGNYVFLPFDTGNIISERQLSITSPTFLQNQIPQTLNARFYTNFGVFTKQLITDPLFGLNLVFNATIPEEIYGEGFYNFSFDSTAFRGASEDLATPVQLGVIFRKISGFDDVVSPPYTKTVTGEFDFWTGASASSLRSFTSMNLFDPLNSEFNNFQQNFQISGSNNFTFSIQKKYNLDNDLFELIISGNDTIVSGQILSLVI
jgi:hypothetical protein